MILTSCFAKNDAPSTQRMLSRFGKKEPHGTSNTPGQALSNSTVGLDEAHEEQRNAPSKATVENPVALQLEAQSVHGIVNNQPHHGYETPETLLDDFDRSSNSLFMPASEEDEQREESFNEEADGNNVDDVSEAETRVINSEELDDFDTESDESEPTEAAIIHRTTNMVAPNTPLTAQERRYETETGITMGLPRIVDAIKEQCRIWTSHGDRERQIDEIFYACRFLEFGRAQTKLLRHLVSQREDNAIKMQMPTTWDMYNEADIITAITKIGDHGDHAKIQKAFAQIKLYDLVQSRISSTPPIKGDGIHLADHMIVLHDMAKAAVGKQSEENERVYDAAHKRAYSAGKQWVETCGWFGGRGTVLVFITAGVLFMQGVSDALADS